MKRAKQGSFTVEATLLMPIIIFIIASIIYFVFYLHDMAYLKSVANNIADKSVEALIYKDSDVATGEINYNTINERFIYWRFGNSFDSIDSSAIAYGQSLVGGNLFITDETRTNITINVKGGCLKKELFVIIKGPVNPPFKFIPQLLNGGKKMHLNITSKAIMSDPSEFIRTIDAMHQVAEQVSFLQKAKIQYDATLDKVRELLKVNE